MIPTEIATRTRNAVGPIAQMYGHGPVTVIRENWVDPDQNEQTVFICLDCGYTATDNRLFAHEECNRDLNPITQTWRELLEEEDHDTFPEPDPDSEWPIED